MIELNAYQQRLLSSFLKRRAYSAPELMREQLEGLVDDVLAEDRRRESAIRLNGRPYAVDEERVLALETFRALEAHDSAAAKLTILSKCFAVYRVALAKELRAKSPADLAIMLECMEAEGGT